MFCCGICDFKDEEFDELVEHFREEHEELFYDEMFVDWIDSNSYQENMVEE